MQAVAKCPGLSMGYVDYKRVLYVGCLTCQRLHDPDPKLTPIKPPSLTDDWDVCPTHIAKESSK